VCRAMRTARVARRRRVVRESRARRRGRVEGGRVVTVYSAVVGEGRRM